MAVRCLVCSDKFGRGKETGKMVCKDCMYQRKLESLLRALNWKDASLELTAREINYMF